MSVRTSVPKGTGNRTPRTCGRCGRPATRLAKSAPTGALLAAAPLLGPCCNPKLRPVSAGALSAFLVGL